MRQTESLTRNFELRKVSVSLIRHFTAWYKLRGLSRRDLILGFMREKIASDKPEEDDHTDVYQDNDYIFCVTQMPREVLRQFDAWCALHGVKQKNVVCACMRKKVKDSVFKRD